MEMRNAFITVSSDGATEASVLTNDTFYFSVKDSENEIHAQEVREVLGEHGKLEMENYIHPEFLHTEKGVNIVDVDWLDIQFKMSSSYLCDIRAILTTFIGAQCMTASSYPSFIKNDPRSTKVGNWFWCVLIDHPVFLQYPFHVDDPNIALWKRNLCDFINKHVPGSVVLPNTEHLNVAFATAIQLPTREFLECLSMFGSNINGFVYPRLTKFGQKCPYYNMLGDISSLDNSFASDDPERVLNNSWDLAYQTPFPPQKQQSGNHIEAIRVKQDGDYYTVEQHFLFSPLKEHPFYDMDFIGGSVNIVVDTVDLALIKVYPKLHHFIKAVSKAEYHVPHNVIGLRKLMENLEILYAMFKKYEDSGLMGGTRYEFRIYKHTLAEAFEFLNDSLNTPERAFTYIGVPFDSFGATSTSLAITVTTWPVPQYVKRVRTVLDLALSLGLHLRRNELLLKPVEKLFSIDLLQMFGISRRGGTRQNDPSAWWALYDSVYIKPSQDALEDKKRLEKRLERFVPLHQQFIGTDRLGNPAKFDHLPKNDIPTTVQPTRFKWTDEQDAFLMSDVNEYLNSHGMVKQGQWTQIAAQFDIIFGTTFGKLGPEKLRERRRTLTKRVARHLDHQKGIFSASVMAKGKACVDPSYDPFNPPVKETAKDRRKRQRAEVLKETSTLWDGKETGDKVVRVTSSNFIRGPLGRFVTFNVDDNLDNPNVRLTALSDSSPLHINTEEASVVSRIQEAKNEDY